MKTFVYHCALALIAASLVAVSPANAHETGVSAAAMSDAMGIPNLQLLTPPQDIHRQEFAEFTYADRYGQKVLTLLVAPASHYDGWRDVQAAEPVKGVGEAAFIVRRTGLMCSRKLDHGACISLDESYFRTRGKASVERTKAALRLAL